MTGVLKVRTSTSPDVWTVAANNGGTSVDLPFIDARSCGVMFDDATDNSTTLQAALDAVKPAGILVFSEGIARYSTPLDLTGMKSVRIIGAAGGGQNSIAPATSLVYTGTTGTRALNATTCRSIEITDVALQHTSSSFTGYLIDFSGDAVSNGSRHVLRRCLIGSTSPSTVKSADGVCVDGCYDIEFDGCGFVGLVDGVQGQIPTASGGRNFSNGVRFNGGYGANISGYHVVNAGNGWSVYGYVAEPRENGVPNFLYVPTTVNTPSVTVTGVDFEDGTATTGAWIEMGGGSLIINGGYFRITGGSVVKLNAAIDTLVIQGITAASVAGQGGSLVDGGSFTSGSAYIGPNRLISMDYTARNFTTTSGVLHNRSNLELPAISGTSSTMTSSIWTPQVRIGSEFGGINILSANASSFEAGITPWSTGSNATVAQSGVQFLDGTKSLSLTSMAAGNMHSTMAPANGFVVTAGEQYTFLASFRAATIARSVRLELYWYTAGNVLTGTGTIGTPVTDSTSGWTQALVTAVAPADAAKTTPILRVLSTGAAAEVHYVDCVSLATGISTVWHASGIGPTVSTILSGTGTPEGVVTSMISSLFLRIDGSTGTSVYIKETGTGNTGWVPVSSGAGGVTDGDKGDIVVSASGATWLFDSAVVTAAAKTVLDDATTTDMRTTLGLGNVENTADSAKPLFSTTTTTAGIVPGSNSLGTGSFLRADGTWALPPGAGGTVGHASFTHNSTLTEPPATSQLRFNNATQSSATKVWVSQNDVDGLDVSVGLAKILAGHQIYIQDYDDASKWIKYNVTAVVDDGAYYDFTVTYHSGPGGIPSGSGAAGRVEFQPVAPGSVGVPPGGTTGQALTKTSATDYAVDWTSLQPLDSDLTTIAGLTATTDNMIQSVGSAWASRTPAQVKTALALDQVTNTTDANKPVSTAQQTALNLKMDLSQTLNAQTGTTYTLVLTDASKLVTLSNASAITLTVPTNASVAFPVGTRIDLVQKGAGQVTVAGTPTVNSTPTKKTRAQYSGMTLVKEATDTWYLFGDLAAT